MKPTLEQIEAEPWLYNPDQWKEAHGVHVPWICEISPMQVGLMSKRQFERHQKERTAVWQASMDSGLEWRTAVVDALKVGKWTIKTSGLSRAAEDAYWHSKVEDSKKAKEDLFKSLSAQNKVESVQIGDIVYDHMNYCKVIKLMPKRFRVIALTGYAPREYNLDLHSVNWVGYGELQRQTEAGITILQRKTFQLEPSSNP